MIEEALRGVERGHDVAREREPVWEGVDREPVDFACLVVGVSADGAEGLSATTARYARLSVIS